MVSSTLQIRSARSPFWRDCAVDRSVIAPLQQLGRCARSGAIGPIGADCSKALPMHQGRPCFFMSFCRSRRVMSRPMA